MNFFKTIVNKCKQGIHLFRTARLAAPYIENGIYHNIGSSVFEKGFGRHPFLIFSIRKQPSPASTFNIFFGSWAEKCIFALPQIVISAYYTQATEKWFANIDKYLPDLPYPHCRYFISDSKKKYNVCERLFGNAIQTEEECFRYAKAILSYNAAAKAFIRQDPITGNDILFFIQHGDAGQSNVFFDPDQGKYTFFDLDTINVFPALYDFFRVLLYPPVVNGFSKYFDGTFDEDLRVFFERNHIRMDDSVKDQYLAAFIGRIYKYKYWLNHGSGLADLPESYVLTRKMIADYS